MVVAGALKIGDARAVEPLIQALKYEERSVRGGAARALGEIGDARAVEPLIQALEDEDRLVRTSAKFALEKIKAKKKIFGKEKGKNKEHWYDKGTAYFDQTEYNKAIECFTKMSEIDPKDERAYLGRAFALHKLNKYNEAIDDYDRVLVLNPTDQSTLMFRDLAVKSKVLYTPVEFKKKEEIDIEIKRKIDFEMILIPAGEFIMGDDGGDSDERPRHRVYLDEFYIMKYPVTNAQYKAFLDDNPDYRVPCYDPKTLAYDFLEDEAKQYCWDPTKRTYPDGKANYPVVLVSFDDASAFAEWAKMRLPTEAEWEKAARGTDGRPYPWGHTPAEHMGGDKCTRSGDITPVDKYPKGASPYGVMDMSGNIWEWCMDWYDANYYQKSAKKNPKGANYGDHRVVRGGGWLGDRAFYSVKCSTRDYAALGYRFHKLGFRCVSDHQL